MLTSTNKGPKMARAMAGIKTIEELLEAIHYQRVLNTTHLYLKSKHQLIGISLYGKDLSGAKFNQCLLRYVYFTNAFLIQVDFKEADLYGADLSGADCTDAIFYCANLRHTDLSRANVKGADFRGALYDDKTQFPEGFDPIKEGMVYE